MEQIINPETGEIDFSRYRAYLDSIREKLPPNVYSFASDSSKFDLDSHNSLHDAWLESLTVREKSTGSRNEVRRMEIEICLLCPFHDRRIRLKYLGVTHYSLTAPPRYEEPRYKHTAHGDLLIHEIRLGQKEFLIHEILFERDSTFLIECSDILRFEEIIDKSFENPD